jgi:hypothetical protein
MMVPDFTPLFYLAFAGVGALIGAVVSVLMAFSGIWFPVMLQWAWIAPIAGLVAGFMYALITDK